MSRSPEALSPQPNRLKRFAIEHPIATTAGVLFTAGVVYANHHLAEKLWDKEGSPGLHTLNEDANPASGGFVFPGMGCSDGENIARLMDAAVPITHPWTYVNYDQRRGLDIKSLAKQYKEFHEKFGFKRTIKFASSMGFATAAEVAYEADIPIDILILDSSPSRHKDGRGSIVGRAANKVPYNFGLLGRYTATVTADTIQRGFKHMPNHLFHAADQTLRGSTPVLIRSHARILENFDFRRDADKYRSVINSNTRVAYISPPKDEDKTVHVDEASDRIRKAVEYLGATFDRFIVPDSHHAYAEKGINELEEWLEKAYAETEHLVCAR